jgi:hypothetical protein
LTDAARQLLPYDDVHALRIVQRCGSIRTGTTGAMVYDSEESPEQQYERTGTPTMSHVLLTVLAAVVCMIGGLAAWTGA